MFLFTFHVPNMNSCVLTTCHYEFTITAKTDIYQVGFVHLKKENLILKEVKIEIIFRILLGNLQWQLALYERLNLLV